LFSFCRIPQDEVKAVEFFVKNHQALKQVIADNDVNQNTINNLYDKNLMEKAKLELEKSTFIKKLIKVSRHKPLAEFVHIWKNRPDFGVENQRDLINLEKEFLQQPDILAYTMHPKFKGAELNKEQKTEVADRVLISLKANNALKEYRNFTDFKECKESFSQNHEFTSLESELFWAHASNFCENVSNIGSKFSSLPSSTVCTRDSAEKFSFLHNTERHDLKETELEKALHVHNTLKFNS
jgi:hypothetical protein